MNRTIARMVGGLALLFMGAPVRAQAPASFRVPKAIAQPNPSLPAAVKQAHPNETLTGQYRICIATDGSVDGVSTMISIPGADQAIIDHVKAKWRYEATPVKVCLPRRFVFKIPPPPIKTPPAETAKPL